MAAPVISPELQWSDANGVPYAGGTLASYVPGTSTPKATWLDPGQAALNTNPVVLDGAGRSLMYGDGDYRIVLRDALGNQIFDGEATTIVSAAMAPVVSAPTLADARNALGVTEAIAQEALDRAAADSAEASTRASQDTAISDYVVAADTVLQNNIDAEKTRAEAAEADLQSQIDGGSVTQFRVGGGITDGSGVGGIAFSPAFPTACDSVVMTVGGTGINCTIRAAGVSASGCTAQVEDTDNTGGVAGAPFYYIAAGH